jgi:CHASE3 domain sensor protein
MTFGSKGQRRTPQELLALAEFLRALEELVIVVGFVLVMAGAVMFAIYGLVHVTQPIQHQAPNDIALIEILKLMLTSIVSILGTLIAVGRGKDSKKKEDSK